MTEDQEDNLHNVTVEAIKRIQAKYRKGQDQHGGNLWERDLLDDAIDEAIDLVIYLLTLKQKGGKTS